MGSLFFLLVSIGVLASFGVFQMFFESWCTPLAFSDLSLLASIRILLSFLYLSTQGASLVTDTSFFRL